MYNTLTALTRTSYGGGGVFLLNNKQPFLNN
jgi:hypothetical protein